MKFDISTVVTSLFLLGIATMDFHLIVYYFQPHTAKIKIDSWANPDFHYEMSVQWYLYEIGRYTAELIWAVASSFCARLVSPKLYKITLIFVLYFGVQLWFYFWDRNVSWWANFWVYTILISAVVYAFVPETKTQGKYRSLY